MVKQSVVCWIASRPEGLTDRPTDQITNNQLINTFKTRRLITNHASARGVKSY